MKIINEKEFGFDKQLEELMPKVSNEIKYEDIEKIPTSPANKRAIWKSMCVIKEITKVMKCEPKNIFIEFARGEEEKVIELSGYLIHSLKAVQNYPAIIETADTVLQYFDKPKFAVERALIKTRKVEALLHTGNFEEVNTIVNTEINPPLQEWLKHPKRSDISNIR